jgi:hypothetical protein
MNPPLSLGTPFELTPLGTSGYSAAFQTA